ncbi:MAG: putative lipid II flippase FtsW [Myxococcales bacterium]|nr:putative lipid II flippase FtsW [Myxococcales bacterium]
MKRSLDTEAPTMMPRAFGYSSTDYVRLIDPHLATAVVFLVGLGLVMVYSASAVRAEEQGGSATVFLLRQLSAIGIGLLALAFTARVPVDRWSRWSTPLLIVTLVLLAAVFVPGVGRKANGAARWIAFGPLSLQPAELAKLSVAVYLANILAKKREQVSSFSMGFFPPVAIVGAIALMVLLQPDFGTAAVLMVMLAGTLFVAGAKVAYLVFAVSATVPVALHYVLTREHARQRIRAFLDPEAYRADFGYQAWESLLSFGSGGITGQGLGRGNQKLFFLPESHTDFIFSVVGQELGFVGVVAVVLAFVVLVGRTFRTARDLPCRFPMFLVFAIGLWIGVQALVHMAVAVALLPTKGLTLPLVSFGRSSLVVTMAAVGIVLRATAEQAVLQGGASPRRSGP